MKTSSFIAATLLVGTLFSVTAAAEEKPVDSAEAAEYEMDAWTSAKDINTIEAYELYLAEYGKGRHAKFAQAAINKLKKEELRLQQQEPGNSGKEAEPVKHPAVQPAAAANAVGAEQKPAVPVPSPEAAKPAAAVPGAKQAENAPVSAEQKPAGPVAESKPVAQEPPVAAQPAAQ